jgi:hypothetical protein
MSIEKLKRVMWRLKEVANESNNVNKKQIEMAIFRECGVTPFCF